MIPVMSSTCGAVWSAVLQGTTWEASSAANAATSRDMPGVFNVAHGPGAAAAVWATLAWREWVEAQRGSPRGRVDREVDSACRRALVLHLRSVTWSGPNLVLEAMANVVEGALLDAAGHAAAGAEAAKYSASASALGASASTSALGASASALGANSKER